MVFGGPGDSKGSLFSIGALRGRSLISVGKSKSAGRSLSKRTGGATPSGEGDTV